MLASYCTCNSPLYDSQLFILLSTHDVYYVNTYHQTYIDKTTAHNLVEQYLYIYYTARAHAFRKIFRKFLQCSTTCIFFSTFNRIINQVVGAKAKKNVFLKPRLTLLRLSTTTASWCRSWWTRGEALCGAAGTAGSGWSCRLARRPCPWGSPAATSRGTSSRTRRRSWRARHWPAGSSSSGPLPPSFWGKLVDVHHFCFYTLRRRIRDILLPWCYPVKISRWWMNTHTLMIICWTSF